MKIGVDIDDCLFPWWLNAHTACEAAGIANGVTPSQWSCWLDYGVPMEDWLEVLAAATLDGSLYAGDPMPGTIDALQRLREAGHTLHIVTARGFFAHGDLIRAATVAWLREHDVPHDSLTFSKDKTLIRCDAFVDDSWKNVSELVAAGVDTWMVDAPHNQDNPYDRRVKSVTEFAEALLAKEHA